MQCEQICLGFFRSIHRINIGHPTTSCLTSSIAASLMISLALLEYLALGAKGGPWIPHNIDRKLFLHNKLIRDI